MPAILALLGDNPMQSELSCHMGMMAKLFCRICLVKGRDADDEEEDEAGPMADDGMSDDGRESPGPSESGAATSGKRRKRPMEKFDDMVDRVKRFLQVITFVA